MGDMARAISVLKTTRKVEEDSSASYNTQSRTDFDWSKLPWFMVGMVAEMR